MAAEVARTGEAPVVVGVDGSASSHTALRWAAAEAARLHRSLHVVHAFEWPGAADLLWPPGLSDYVDRANALVDESAAEVSGAFPGLAVTATARPGDAAQMLLNASRRAALVVVGGRSHGRLMNVLVGSVGQAVATWARCSVAVVHGEPAVLAGPVLVGVDSSTAADVALHAAFDEAAARSSSVLAVRAWSPPGHPRHGDVRPLVTDMAELEATERRDLADVLQPWQEKYPDVPVELLLVAGDAGDVLVAASREARLTVVGTRGHSRATGLLGPVSQHVLQHASGALLVARARNGDQDIGYS